MVAEAAEGVGEVGVGGEGEVEEGVMGWGAVEGEAGEVGEEDVGG